MPPNFTGTKPKWNQNAFTRRVEVSILRFKLGHTEAARRIFGRWEGDPLGYLETAALNYYALVTLRESIEQSV